MELNIPHTHTHTHYVIIIIKRVLLKSNLMQTKNKIIIYYCDDDDFSGEKTILFTEKKS